MTKKYKELKPTIAQMKLIRALEKQIKGHNQQKKQRVHTRYEADNKINRLKKIRKKQQTEKRKEVVKRAREGKNTKGYGKMKISYLPCPRCNQQHDRREECPGKIL